MSAGRGQLVVLSGPGGVGKSSICERLLADKDIVLSVSSTTRAPRGGEQDGVDYHFVEVAEFKRMIEAGELLEYAVVHKRDFYGTLREPVLSALDAGRHVLLDIDVQGADQLRSQGLPLVTIFISPPSLEALQKRLEGRGDTTPEAIAARLRSASDEIAQAGRFDHEVVNDDLDQAVSQIKKILAS